MGWRHLRRCPSATNLHQICEKIHLENSDFRSSLLYRLGSSNPLNWIFRVKNALHCYAIFYYKVYANIRNMINIVDRNVPFALDFIMLCFPFRLLLCSAFNTYCDNWPISAVFSMYNGRLLSPGNSHQWFLSIVSYHCHLPPFHASIHRIHQQ